MNNVHSINSHRELPKTGTPGHAYITRLDDGKPVVFFVVPDGELVEFSKLLVLKHGVTPGERGEQGRAGSTGLPGSNGRDGRDGRDGAQSEVPFENAVIPAREYDLRAEGPKESLNKVSLSTGR